MGRLMIPPTADPASNTRGKPAGPTGVGNEKTSDIGGAMSSNPGPGATKNTGGDGLGFSSSAIHGALK